MSLNLLILRSGCSYGFFGQNCANKCNSTCTGCNSVNGSCDSGCIPGWTGYYCNKRDDMSGFYEFDLSFQYNALYLMSNVFNLHVGIQKTQTTLINVKPTVWMIYLYTVLVHVQVWSQIDIIQIRLEIRKC